MNDTSAVLPSAMIEYMDAYLHILHLYSFPYIKLFRCQQQRVYASPNLSGRSTGAKLQS
jgi:hypothetical protein